MYVFPCVPAHVPVLEREGEGFCIKQRIREMCLARNVCDVHNASVFVNVCACVRERERERKRMRENESGLCVFQKWDLQS